jgi:hypothetical protein
MPCWSCAAISKNSRRSNCQRVSDGTNGAHRCRYSTRFARPDSNCHFRAVHIRDPYVPQNISEYRGSNIGERTTRHVGYRISQAVRNRIEEADGWIKEAAAMDQAPFRGLPRMGRMFQLRVALAILFDCHGCRRQDEAVRRNPEAPSEGLVAMRKPRNRPQPRKSQSGKGRMRSNLGFFSSLPGANHRVIVVPRALVVGFPRLWADQRRRTEKRMYGR